MPKSWIAVSACPLTQPSANEIERLLFAFRSEQFVRVYQADGDGGRALEADVLAGRVTAVIEFSLAELAAELTGAPGGAGPDRLTAAALRGIPQVIALGAPDAIRMSGEHERLGERRTTVYDGRHYSRTTPEQNDQLGRDIAHKASAARGPTVILVPRRGLSALDIEGGPFWWPEADSALVQSLRNWISPHVRVRELDLHIGDSEFAAAAVAELKNMV